MRKQCTRSVTSLQVPQPSGLITEPNTKDKVKDTIFSEVHNKQYTLAKEAPICSGKLFEDY